MAVQNGYGKSSGSESLVFAYDLKDTVNSYRGEPTINLVTPSGIDMTLLSTYTYLGGSQVSELSSPSSFACEMIVEDSQINTASRIKFGGAENIPTSGNTFISVSVKFQGGPTSNIIPRVFAGVGWTTLNPLDGGLQFITAEYRRFGALIQMGTSSGGPNPGFSMTQNNGNIQVGQKTRWHSPQVESKSHATPFINGTRSNTQGLLDLTGNSSINLSNVSFDSNAQMTFDGTDDYGSIGNNSAVEFTANEAHTLEYMVYLNALPSGFYATIMKGSFSSSYGHLIVTGTNKLLVYLDADSSVEHTSTYAFQAQKWTHVVTTFSGDTSSIYIDGNLDSTQTGLSLTTNTNNLFIGSNGGGNYFLNGKMNLAKIYNRALTSTEVVNNYLKYKRQYGLT